MILSALAEKIAEGGQDALTAEHADLGDLLIVQRLLGHANSTMRSLCYIRRTNLNGRRSDARTRRTQVPVGGEAA